MLTIVTPGQYNLPCIIWCTLTRIPILKNTTETCRTSSNLMFHTDVKFLMYTWSSSIHNLPQCETSHHLHPHPHKQPYTITLVELLPPKSGLKLKQIHYMQCRISIRRCFNTTQSSWSLKSRSFIQKQPGSNRKNLVPSRDCCSCWEIQRFRVLLLFRAPDRWLETWREQASIQVVSSAWYFHLAMLFVLYRQVLTGLLVC